MILITERRKVMQLGKHYIYKIEATMTIPVFVAQKKGQSHDPLEARCVFMYGVHDTLACMVRPYVKTSMSVLKICCHNLGLCFDAIAGTLKHFKMWTRPVTFTSATRTM